MRSNRRRDWIRMEWYPPKPTSNDNVILLVVVVALVSFIVGFVIGQ